MSNKQIFFLVVVFLISFSLVLKMIIKNQLREVYAVMWIIVVFSLPGAIFLYPFLENVSIFVGIGSPINFAFFVGFVIIFAIALHFSAINSGMQKTLKNVVQEIAVLGSEIGKIKKSIGENETNSNKISKAARENLE